jgi:hypothetical protein
MVERAMRSFAIFALAACSSPAVPQPAQPVTPREAPADAAPPPVASDTRPDISLTAPAYVFRFASQARAETWTLWFASGVAMLNVDTAGGTVRQYQGSATEGTSIGIEVASATAKIKLDCKRAKREVDAACDPGAPRPNKAPKKIQVDALDCFHADFKEPMPFGPKPGIEYVADGTCAGYRVISAGGT